jgi:two-component system NtrC family sensor kinase
VTTEDPNHELTRPAVLVVDDIQGNLVAFEALLGDLDCDIVCVRSGDAALRQLLRREFAVMLLDVQMPEMDGYEVASHARANPGTREVPIVFLTATHDNEENVLRGYGSGAVDFLFKPVDPTILRAKVQVFLDLYAGKRLIGDSKRALERTNEELNDAYRELKKTHAQLVQSAKMASLGELVAGIAHEINNPLAFALSHLDTARRDLTAVGEATSAALPDPLKPRWARAETRLLEMGVGLERIRELIVKLRTFSRLDEGEHKLVDVRASVESVLTILGHRLKDRITVETTFEPPAEIECYPSLLNQALMNLVGNSIDAMEDGGTVGIHAGAHNGQFEIVVSDTGHGIPDAIKDRVLEPFFTTKEVGKGTGLGLSITYSIIQKHGGSIVIEDGDPTGTRIRLRIPLRASNAPRG